MWKYNYNYLEHYGIKGMKWGVRRYQNKDGTLTAEGRKRLNSYVNPDGTYTKKKVFKKVLIRKLKKELKHILVVRKLTIL